jgi:biotin carboxyl carrier protein
MKTFEFKIGGKDYKVDIERFDGKRAMVKVDGKPFEIDVKKAAQAVFSGRTITPPPRAAAARPAAPEPVSAPAPSPSVVTGDRQVVAPMPGLILDIMAAVGDTVGIGTPIIKMEAMKMENEIPAPVTGTIREIRVKKGDRVSTDQVLAVIQEG